MVVFDERLVKGQEISQGESPSSSPSLHVETATLSENVREQELQNNGADESSFSFSADLSATPSSPSVDEPKAQEQKPISQDDRVSSFHALREEARSKQSHAESISEGAKKNYESSGFYGWLSGSQAADKKFYEAQSKHAEEIEQSISDAESLMERFAEQEKQGRAFESQGKIKEAQECYNNAQRAYLRSQEKLTSIISLSSGAAKNYHQELSAANESLAATERTLHYTEIGLKGAHTVTVVAGATVVTVGTGGVAGVALGAAAGTGIGVLGNAVEGIGHVGWGNKSADEALRDATTQSVSDAKTATITAVSAVTGAGTAQAVSSKLGQAASSVSGRVLTGASAGASGASVSTAISTTERYQTALNDFQEEYGHLSAVEQEQLWPQYAEQRGVTAGQLMRDATIDVGVGALSGGLGGSASVVNKSAHIGRQVAIEGAEIGADAGIGLSSAYVKARADGRELTADDIVNEAVSAIGGGLLGKSTASQNTQREAVIQAPQSLETAPGVRTSTNGKAVFVDDPQLIKDQYAKQTTEELTEVGLDPHAAEVLARSEAAGVEAYYDSQSGKMILPAVNVDGSRQARLIAASYARHEHAHVKGMSEQQAWLSQGEYLASPDLGADRIRLDLSGDSPHFRPFRENDPSDTLTQAEVDNYVERSYSGPESRLQRATGGAQRRTNARLQMVAEYYGDKTDLELDAAQQWARNCRGISMLLKDHPELAQAFRSGDPAQIGHHANEALKTIPKSHEDAFYESLYAAESLMSMNSTVADPTTIPFLFRGQNARNQLVPESGVASNDLFLATSTEPQILDLYSRDGTEALALYNDPEAPLAGIPIPNNAREIGLYSEAEVTRRGLEHFDEGMNFGGYATRNDEIVLKPGHNLQFSPHTVDYNGIQVRPVVSDAATVTAERWQTIHNRLEQRLDTR